MDGERKRPAGAAGKDDDPARPSKKHQTNISDFFAKRQAPSSTGAGGPAPPAAGQSAPPTTNTPIVVSDSPIVVSDSPIVVSDSSAHGSQAASDSNDDGEWGDTNEGLDAVLAEIQDDGDLEQRYQAAKLYFRSKRVDRWVEDTLARMEPDEREAMHPAVETAGKLAAVLYGNMVSCDATLEDRGSITKAQRLTWGDFDELFPCAADLLLEQVATEVVAGVRTPLIPLHVLDGYTRDQLDMVHSGRTCATCITADRTRAVSHKEALRKRAIIYCDLPFNCLLGDSQWSYRTLGPIDEILQWINDSALVEQLKKMGNPLYELVVEEEPELFAVLMHMLDARVQHLQQGDASGKGPDTLAKERRIIVAALLVQLLGPTGHLDLVGLPMVVGVFGPRSSRSKGNYLQMVPDALIGQLGHVLPNLLAMSNALNALKFTDGLDRALQRARRIASLWCARRDLPDGDPGCFPAAIRDRIWPPADADVPERRVLFEANPPGTPLGGLHDRGERARTGRAKIKELMRARLRHYDGHQGAGDDRPRAQLLSTLLWPEYGLCPHHELCVRADFDLPPWDEDTKLVNVITTHGANQCLLLSAVPGDATQFLDALNDLGYCWACGNPRGDRVAVNGGRGRGAAQKPEGTNAGRIPGSGGLCKRCYQNDWNDTKKLQAKAAQAKAAQGAAAQE
ncbi:unnamed protein product [Pedinophyceae sp. YPF-701]|nr:unnamed protein product [Pedinophyceae sp. YPF-701]